MGEGPCPSLAPPIFHGSPQLNGDKRYHGIRGQKLVSAIFIEQRPLVREADCH